MELIRYNQYSREDLHLLTIADKTFKRGAGKWGLQGIVKVPETNNDYVFFVTFGQEEGGHVFQEGISKNGVLSWQSQPKQKLHHPQIRRFIDHNSIDSNIYLLLRTQSNHDYTYLGLLKYLSHDSNRQQPVWFQWQIIDWEIKESLFEKIGLKIENNQDRLFRSPPFVQKNELKEVNRKPTRRIERITSSPIVRERKIDYASQSIKNKSIGDKGEFLVLEWEKLRLINLGINKEPKHVASENDNAGYDILSYDNTGSEIFIEVKTTKGSIESPFYVTSNEIQKSNEYRERYCLYRLYDYSEENNSALFYRVQGPLDSIFDLKPKDFIAHYKGKDDHN